MEKIQVLLMQLGLVVIVFKDGYYSKFELILLTYNELKQFQICIIACSGHEELLRYILQRNEDTLLARLKLCGFINNFAGASDHLNANFVQLRDRRHAPRVDHMVGAWLPDHHVVQAF